MLSRSITRSLTEGIVAVAALREVALFIMSVSYPFTITRASFQPAYLKVWESGLSRRVGLALQRLADCALCPRICHVNRPEDATN